MLDRPNSVNPLGMRLSKSLKSSKRRVILLLAASLLVFTAALVARLLDLKVTTKLRRGGWEQVAMPQTLLFSSNFYSVS